MAITAAELIVRATADVSDAERGLSSLSKKIPGIGTAAVAAGAVFATAFAGIGAAVGVSVGAAADFEKTMSGVKAVSGASADDMQRLSGLALQLGKDTSFSASEAAQGLEELVKGGVSIADIMGGGAKAALDLAAAGEIGLKDAAEIASNAMNSFGLTGKDMAHVADQIAGAANASSLDVTDFKFSLAAVGAVAKLAGQDFDSTATAIALMGQAGIKGSDAGTSLKTFLMNLQPTTKAAATEMRQLGIITADGANAFFDATGKAKGMREISEVLTNALAGMTEQQKLSALQTLFGSDAIRAASVLASGGAKAYDEMAGSMSKVTAASVGAERLNNLAGSMEQLKGSVETAAITFGMALLPALKSAVDAATGFVNASLPWIETAGPQFLGVLQSVAGFIAAELVPRLVDVGKWIIDVGVPKVLEFAGKLKDDLTPAFNTVVGFVRDTLLPKLKEFGGWIIETAIPRLQGFADTLRQVLTPAFDTVVGFVRDTLLPKLQEIGKWIIETAIPKLGELATNLKTTLTPAFETVANFVKDTLLPKLQEVGKWIIETALPKLGELADNLKTTLTPAFRAVSDFIKDTLLPKLGEFWQFINDQVIPKLNEFADTLRTVTIPAVQEFAAAVKSTTDKEFAAFMEELGKRETIKTFKDALDDLRLAVEKMQTVFGGFVMFLLAPLGPFIVLKSQLDKVAGSSGDVKTGMAGVADWISDNVDRFRQFTKDINKIADAFVSAKDAVNNFFSALKTWLDQHLNIPSLGIGGSGDTTRTTSGSTAGGGGNTWADQFGGRPGSFTTVDTGPTTSIWGPGGPWISDVAAGNVGSFGTPHTTVAVNVYNAGSVIAQHDFERSVQAAVLSVQQRGGTVVSS